MVCPFLVDLLLHSGYLLLNEDVVLLEVVFLLSDQVFEEIDLLLKNLHLLHVHLILDLKSVFQRSDLILIPVKLLLSQSPDLLFLCIQLIRIGPVQFLQLQFIFSNS